MHIDPQPPHRNQSNRKRPSRKHLYAYSVHLLTVSGIVPAFAAMVEIISESCNAGLVLVYLLIATVIDAVDGPLARLTRTKTFAAAIDGRTIDDILDYLTFAFIPLLLIARMDWLPAGTGFVVVLGMAASLLGFAHRDAKDEAAGSFRGFPSYWNVFALYAGILSTATGNGWWTLGLLVFLSVLTVSPVRFLYPNLAPGRWRRWVLWGSVLWAINLLVLLPGYPSPPVWLTLVSLVYPVFYIGLSLWLLGGKK